MEETEVKEESTNSPSPEPVKRKGGPSPMIAVVVIVILVILGLVYYFAVVKKGQSQPSAVNTQSSAPSTQSATNNAVSSNIYTEKTDTAKGTYLADFAGMTLYTFDKDTKGVSNCSGNCATLWPPYTSGATVESMLPANITVITRTDGSKQFAWDGMPLYYYSKDTKAGDINGDGVGGVWHIAKLTASGNSMPAQSPATKNQNTAPQNPNYNY